MKIPHGKKVVVVSLEDEIIGEDRDGVRHSGGVTRDKGMVQIFSYTTRRGVDIVRIFDQWTPEGEHREFPEGLPCQA